VSQKLPRSQTKWSTLDREAFATVQKCHAIVWVVHIIVYSDHAVTKQCTFDALADDIAAIFNRAAI